MTRSHRMTTTLRQSPLLLAALVALWPVSTAWAYAISLASGAPVKWYTSSPVPYYVDPDAATSIPGDEDVQVVHDAFAKWTSIDCADVAVEFAGSTNATSVISTGAQLNGKNELIWVDTAAWQYGPYVLGVTAPVFSQTGAIQEADIAFNDYSAQWALSPAPNKVDAMSIVLHEEGHWFGVQHNLYPTPGNPETMAPAWNGTTQARSLEKDDQLALCFLYPKGGQFTCTSDTECPAVLDVVAGQEKYVSYFGCDNGTCAQGQGGPTGAQSCAGRCGAFDQTAGCQCDDQCAQYGDCCPDACTECNVGCGGGSGGGGTGGGGTGGGGGSLDCAGFFDCAQNCQTQQCVNSCASTTSPEGLKRAQDVITCFDQNGCFNVQSQQEFQTCAQTHCADPVEACFAPPSGGGTGGDNPDAGSTEPGADGGSSSGEPDAGSAGNVGQDAGGAPDEADAGGSGAGGNGGQGGTDSGAGGGATNPNGGTGSAQTDGGAGGAQPDAGTAGGGAVGTAGSVDAGSGGEGGSSSGGCASGPAGAVPVVPALLVLVSLALAVTRRRRTHSTG